MINMSRFQPPQPHEEPTVKCSQCTTTRYYDEMYYDERGERYFCSRDCFTDWAGDNFEDVDDYYWDMNIG